MFPFVRTDVLTAMICCSALADSYVRCGWLLSVAIREQPCLLDVQGSHYSHLDHKLRSLLFPHGVLIDEPLFIYTRAAGSHG